MASHNRQHPQAQASHNRPAFNSNPLRATNSQESLSESMPNAKYKQVDCSICCAQCRRARYAKACVGLARVLSRHQEWTMPFLKLCLPYPVSFQNEMVAKIMSRVGVLFKSFVSAIDGAHFHAACRFKASTNPCVTHLCTCLPVTAILSTEDAQQRAQISRTIVCNSVQSEGVAQQTRNLRSYRGSCSQLAWRHLLECKSHSRKCMTQETLAMRSKLHVECTIRRKGGPLPCRWVGRLRKKQVRRTKRKIHAIGTGRFISKTLASHATKVKGSAGHLRRDRPKHFTPLANTIKNNNNSQLLLGDNSIDSRSKHDKVYRAGRFRGAIYGSYVLALPNVLGTVERSSPRAQYIRKFHRPNHGSFQIVDTGRRQEQEARIAIVDSAPSAHSHALELVVKTHMDSQSLEQMCAQSSKACDKMRPKRNTRRGMVARSIDFIRCHQRCVSSMSARALENGTPKNVHIRFQGGGAEPLQCFICLAHKSAYVPKQLSDEYATHCRTCGRGACYKHGSWEVGHFHCVLCHGKDDSLLSGAKDTFAVRCLNKAFQKQKLLHRNEEAFYDFLLLLCAERKNAPTEAANKVDELFLDLQPQYAASAKLLWEDARQLVEAVLLSRLGTPDAVANVLTKIGFQRGMAGKNCVSARQ